jgi:predicted ATPase/class 3 adenylate cyclase
VNGAAPSGVVTFLFTDIEGSTRRWEADPDVMRVALETHNKVLREAVETHQGQVFTYTGDGMCAVFGSPRSAVDAAVDAQRALELPVRMGIATGEAELRGDDYFGTVLNRTARVMAAGHGGQILLDGATAALISGVDLTALGPRRLRDIAKPVDMFQVQASGLRTDFPPLKTVDPTPGNLRLPTTSIIGRESELAELLTALKAHRLVTLTGVGGVGKTRLAMEVAARSAEHFPDGVFVIELAAVTDPAAIPEAVAAVLGILQQPGLSLSDSVAAALDGRCRLLVFDNCEHVLDAAADIIESIIAQSHTVEIMATSREGLRLADEQLWPVPSLDVRAGVESSAANLFLERAHAVAADSSLTDSQHADAVVEICRRLDGIPLAIELAASRMQSMTVTEMRDRLDDRFRLLVGSRRGLERHQTLRHAVQWSYDLLDIEEQALLNRCSVFAGGFDLAAARAVGAAGDDVATLDLLDALVRKSLLGADRSSERTRFSMLETIRQFAEERLEATGASGETRAAHCRYYAGLEADVLAQWDSPRQRETYSWFAVEMANLRSAFRYAADCGDLESGAAITSYAAMLGYWVQQYEPTGWAEELINAAKAVDHPRLAQLYVIAALCFTTGRSDDFLRYIDAAEVAIDSGRFDHVPVVHQAVLGGGYLTIVTPERCVQWCRATIARNPEEPRYILTNLVFALEFAGAHEEAVALSEELLDAFGDAANPALRCAALMDYAYTHGKTAPAEAFDALRRVLAIAQSNGDRQVESAVALNLSSVAANYADPEDALEFVDLAIRTYYESGSFGFVSRPMGILVALLDKLGEYEPAGTISHFFTSPMSAATYPEITAAVTHLREVLGDPAYESLVQTGSTMTQSAKVKYALAQIDRVRAELA